MQIFYTLQLHRPKSDKALANLKKLRYKHWRSDNTAIVYVKEGTTLHETLCHLREVGEVKIDVVQRTEFAY